MENEILKQAPEIIPVLTDPANLIVNICLAVVTFLAVTIALFQEPIRKFFNKAELKIKIKMHQPYSHKIGLTDGQGRLVRNCIYIRISVEIIKKNIKSSIADNVEVMISNIWKIEENGSKHVLNSFLPMNLKWSHTGESTKKITIGIEKLCDLGSISNHSQIPNRSEVRLRFDTIVQPNPVANGSYPNILDPGKYHFELSLSGDNVKPIKKIWELEFDGIWTEDEREMLDRHIRIEEVE